MNYILASASPRRREILSHIGLKFTVCTADTDETSDERRGEQLVELLAARKASAVRNKLSESSTLTSDTVILAADTVVISPSGNILGKPKNEADALRMLRELSGNTHRVMSGIAVIRNGKLATAHETTEVTFMSMPESVITRYVNSGEPLDKAGAYGIQDTAALWISSICGDYFNVVGLPLHRLEQLLNREFHLSLWENDTTQSIPSHLRPN